MYSAVLLTADGSVVAEAALEGLEGSDSALRLLEAVRSLAGGKTSFPFVWTKTLVSDPVHEAIRFVNDVYRGRTIVPSDELRMYMRFLYGGLREEEEEQGRMMTCEEALGHARETFEKATTLTRIVPVGVRYRMDVYEVYFPVTAVDDAALRHIREILTHSGTEIDFYGLFDSIASHRPLDGVFYARRFSDDRHPEVERFFHSPMLLGYVSKMPLAAGRPTARPPKAPPQDRSVTSLSASFGALFVHLAEYPIFLVPDKALFPIVKYETHKKLISLHINRESIDGPDSINAFVRNLNVVLATRHDLLAEKNVVLRLRCDGDAASMLVVLGDCGQGRAILGNADTDRMEELQALVRTELSAFVRTYAPAISSHVESWKTTFRFTCVTAAGQVASVQLIDRYVRNHSTTLPLAAWECHDDNVVLRYMAVDGCMDLDPAVYLAASGGEENAFAAVESRFRDMLKRPVTVVVRPKIASGCYEVEAVDFEFRTPCVLDRFCDWMVHVLNECSLPKIKKKADEQQEKEEEEEEEKEQDFLDEYFAEVDEEVGDDDDEEEEDAKARPENELLRQLEAADRALFAWPTKLHSNFSKYSTKCQKHRQPVVVSDKELGTFDGDESGKFGEYGTYEAYGTTPEKAAHNRYICPDVWCPISRVPMSFDQFRANGNQCPFPSVDETPIIRRAKKKNMVAFFEPNIHPDGYCMPCCSIKKKPCTSSTAARGDDQQPSSKYIKEDGAVLANGRFGTLPKLFFAMFNNTRKRCGGRSKKSTGNINRDTTCFVRRGTSTGSYVEAALRARFGDEPRAWESVCDLIERSLTPEVFLTLGGGSVAKIFVKQFVKSTLYVKDEQVVQFLEDNASYKSQFNVDPGKASAFRRERIVYGAMRMFFGYLRSPTVVKTPDIVECLFNSPTSYLNPDAHTIVTIDGPTSSVIQHSLLLAHHRSRLFEGQLKVSFVYGSIDGFSRAFDNVCLIQDGAESTAFAADVSTAVLNKLVDGSEDDHLAVFEHLLSRLLQMDEVPAHYVISIDFAIVGVLCKSGVYVQLPAPVEMVPLPPGITYLHEIDVVDHVPEAYAMTRQKARELLAYLGYAVVDDAVADHHLDARHSDAPDVRCRFCLDRAGFARVAEVGELDHALLFHTQDDNGVRHFASSDEIELFAALSRAKKRVRKLKTKTLVSMVTSLRNTLNPIPEAAKRAILSEHICEGADGDVLARALLESGMKVLSQGFFNMLRPPSHKICVLTLPDMVGRDGAIDVVRVVDQIVRPFFIPTTFAREVKISVAEELQDTKVEFAKEESKMSSIQAAIFGKGSGESKPFTKWQKLLKGFSVYAPAEFDADFLYKLYHHVSIRVGTMSKLGWSDLKRIATNFISSNVEMIALALSLNESLYRICNGSVELAAKVVKNGNYVPSYAEICVLSHITNVRTIVFKRQSQDDDGLMCMNNKDTSVMYVMLQHRYNRALKVDCFDVVAKDKPNVVILDGSLGRATRDYFVDRCSNENCWDDQCLKVTQQALKKKFT